MSQVTLLEEVSRWDQETCRQELNTVLPKLLSMHQETISWEEHTNILQIITSKFLPHLSLSDLENGCFSIVLPKVLNVFGGFLEEISKQIGDLSSQNTELQLCFRKILQMMVQTLEALSFCVRHVCSIDEVVSFVTIHSLPSSILRVLKDTFQHCKDSEVMYSGKISLLGDLLQALFKEAYSLQKGLMELLDKISLEDNASEEEVSDTVLVIHSLLEICCIISKLDIALHANTWKCLIKQSVKYQSIIEDRLHHTDISFCLCEDLSTAVENCLELAQQIQQAGLQEAVNSAEYKLFQKTTKMCRFFANTLVHYTKEFQAFLAKSCCHFHQLYLRINSKFPPSLCAPSIPVVLSEELRVAILVPMDAMLTQLLPFQPFAESVLNPDIPTKTSLFLPQCLLVVNVLGKLFSQSEETLRLWIDGSQLPEENPRWSVFEAVLQSFRLCTLERSVPVCLPGVMLRGQAQGTVSLHQHVCAHMCASVAVLPPQHFPPLERSLLAAVLQFDTQTAVLSADIWCFLARYGTADLCFHHVLIITHLVKSCPQEGYQLLHLGLLLRRMLFFMTPKHQMKFVESFPPSHEENLCVWRHTLLRCLSTEALVKVEEMIIAKASLVVEEWKSNGYRLGDISKLTRILECVLLVIIGSNPRAESMESSVMIISQLWSRMSSSQVQVHPPLQRMVRILLSTSAVLVKELEPHIILQAITCLSGLSIHKCPDELLLAALEMLASLGKILIPPNTQCQVLPKISALFYDLLTHPCWLVHQHVLEAFGLFAEITNHEEVISQTLISEEVKSSVLSFLSKTTSQQESGKTRLERLQQCTDVLERHCKHLKKGSSENTAPPEEPCPKRPRRETKAEKEYDKCLQTAEGALKALQLVQRTENTPSPPEWVRVRLQHLQTLITQISSTEEQHSTSGGF